MAPTRFAWFLGRAWFRPDKTASVHDAGLDQGGLRRLAKLKIGGAGTAAIARLHFAFEEAKKLASDR